VPVYCGCRRGALIVIAELSARYGLSQITG
jgi:hypothetical protein